MFYSTTKLKVVLLPFLLGILQVANAQQAGFSILNREYLIPLERKLLIDSVNFHSNCRPFAQAELPSDNIILKDSVHSFAKKIMHYGIFSKQEPGFKFALSPLVTLLTGYEFRNSKSIIDTRLGLRLNLAYKNKWGGEIQLVNTNGDYPSRWNNYAQGAKVLQGNGYAYPSNLGYTNLQCIGSLSFMPNNHFNFSAGRGKHFFGDGYRSLLLSDVASNYDYLKITTTIWKIKYVNLFGSFKDIRNSAGKNSRFQNKYATFHYLSWNATKRINISFFESIIWQSRDSNNRNLGYDVNYLNPVIFYRPTEYSLGSSDNALIGMSFKVKLFKKQLLYGQLLIDEFLLKEIRAQSGWWANKQGVQLGLKSYDFLKFTGLFFQVEWNSVRPYTYAHSNTFQNYGHFNESLAHPLGANFSEYFSNINYQKNYWMIDLKYTYAQVGLDSAGKNFGQNIYQSNLSHEKEFGNKIGQGTKTNIHTFQFSYSYLLNKANNIRLELGFVEQLQSNNFSNLQNTYFYLGIRTALNNAYFDF